MKMQVAIQVFSSQLVRTLTPMVGTFLVLTFALVVVRLTVGSRFVRGLAAYAAAFAWFGWMALIYKPV